MRFGVAWLSGLVGLLAVLVAPVAAAESPPPRDLEELRARVAEILEREGVPGAGIALVAGDRTLWAGGVGLADRAAGRPVTGDTLFRVGSISKSVLALAVMRLVEEGRLDLGARVSDLAPELAIDNRWAAEQPITVAHLLEHTAGFDDMHPNETFAPLAAEAMPLADVLARNPASRVARWRPGSRSSYANPGYTVAGYIIEKVTGRPYEEVLGREILRPLGMSGAALRWTPEVDTRLARGYERGEAPVPYAVIYHRPAGNLMASPLDMAELVKLFLGRGRFGGVALISPASMARIERSETARVGSGDGSYGLGNYGEVHERTIVRGHNGGIDGFFSSYGYMPAAHVGYVLLLNSSRSWRAVEEIRHLLVEYLLTDAQLPPPPERAPVPDEELRRWAGTYHFAAPRHQLFAFLERMQPGIEVSVDSGHIYVRPVPSRLPWRELIPLGGDRFRAPRASGSHIGFGRDDEGRRAFSAGGGYFVEEPRWKSVAFVVVPPLVVWLLATGVLLPLAVFRRRLRPSPGFGWPLCASLSFFAVPRLFVAIPFAALGEVNVNSVGIFVLTLTFAVGSIGSAVQALVWLPRPIPLAGKLYRLLFAIAACSATAYLAAYGILGIRLWSY